jgi:hypothetical protein
MAREKGYPLGVQQGHSRRVGAARNPGGNTALDHAQTKYTPDHGEEIHGPGRFGGPGLFFWGAAQRDKRRSLDYAAHQQRRNRTMGETQFDNAEIGFAEAVTLMLELGYTAQRLRWITNLSQINFMRDARAQDRREGLRIVGDVRQGDG